MEMNMVSVSHDLVANPRVLRRYLRDLTTKMSWDDGKHTKVNKVQLTFDDAIRSIEVGYEGTNLKSQRRGTVGTKSDGFTLSTDEYITNLSGYYRTTFSGDFITALTFQTNKKTYGPYGNKTQSYFSADAPSGNQIAGFLGTSGIALSSIDVHFAPIPTPGSINPQTVNPGNGGGGGGSSNPGDSGTDSGKDGPGKIGPLGGDKGNEFKDVGFEGVKKITVGADQYSVTYIKIEYVKDGKVVVREHGTIRGELNEFSVDYPKDNIVAVGGTFNHIYNYDTTLITSLYFTTSKGFTSPLFGKTKGTEFNLKGESGGKLLGFHGRGGNAIDAIGAYFDTGSKTGGAGKIEPLGGDKGKEFNDVGFEGVKKITVGADEYSVSYIKIEYVKEGKIEILEHGTSRGELKEFSVDYPKENIVAVGGSYNHIYNYDTTLITSLYFTTSRGFTSPLFGKLKGTEFELKGENGGKLLGFHGRGGFAIDAIGAYFDTGSQGGDGSKDGPKPVVPGTDSGSGSKTDVPGKQGPLGGDKGKEFNDVGFEGVKKITVGADDYSVSYIKIEYVKEGKVEILEHGTSRGELKEFSVDYPKDNIVAVGGTYNHIYNYDTTLITSLYFTTSKGLTSPLFGKKKGTDFNLKGENGGKLLGFHGRGGFAIDAIGAYFDTGSQGGDEGKDGSKPDIPGKKGPLGGDRGQEFNDVGFQGVKKITVGADNLSITYIKIEYVKDGKVEIREHGTNRGELKEFSVDYPKDSITAVGGSYKHNYANDTTLITSLYFTTSKGYTSPLFGENKGTDFEFKGDNGGKLLGFHGRGGNAIDAIGAYFDTSSQGGKGSDTSSKPDVPGTDTGAGSNSTQKLDAQGGKGGNQWDDGGDHEGVTKILVAVSRGSVEQIRFDYFKNGQTKEGPPHGVKGARALITTIEISHPNEYLLSVKGWSDASNKIVGIQFITNTRTSEYCGFEKLPEDEGTDISLEVKDEKIVGFHGFADTHLNSLGAYFAPIASTPLKPSKKLKAVGGDEGASWDDGVFDGVKKIQVGQNNDGVGYVAIEYENGSQKVLGDGHGKKSKLGVDTFELSPGEYLTTVGVYYEKLQIEGRGVTLVTCLMLKTNKQDYSQFGVTSGEYVELKEEGHKIVGFHGKASDWIHQIGVYVAPITN